MASVVVSLAVARAWVDEGGQGGHDDRCEQSPHAPDGPATLRFRALKPPPGAARPSPRDGLAGGERVHQGAEAAVQCEGLRLDTSAGCQKRVALEEP